MVTSLIYCPAQVNKVVSAFLMPFQYEPGMFHVIHFKHFWLLPNLWSVLFLEDLNNAVIKLKSINIF